MKGMGLITYPEGKQFYLGDQQVFRNGWVSLCLRKWDEPLKASSPPSCEWLGNKHFPQAFLETRAEVYKL